MGARPSGWSCGNYSFRSRRGPTRIERVGRSIAGRISGWALAAVPAFTRPRLRRAAITAGRQLRYHTRELSACGLAIKEGRPYLIHVEALGVYYRQI